mgnify:FL=1
MMISKLISLFELKIIAIIPTKEIIKPKITFLDKGFCLNNLFNNATANGIIAEANDALPAVVF